MALKLDEIKETFVEAHVGMYGCPKCGKRYSAKTSGYYYVLKHIGKCKGRHVERCGR